MALTDIQKVRIEVGDTDVSLPILPDDTYTYLLTKNNNSVARASLDAARIILLNLSQRDDTTVDIFSIKGSKAASEYRQSLILFLQNPALNPILNGANTQVFFGGTSVSANQANTDNSDNVTVKIPGDMNAVKIGYFDFLGN